MSAPLRTLINKLDSHARLSLETASAQCVTRGQQEVEVEHWLLALVTEPAPGLVHLCRTFDLDMPTWQQGLETFLNQLPDGGQRRPVLSQSLIQALEKAWLFASLDCEATRLQSLHLIGALLCDPTLRRLMETSCKALVDRVSADQALDFIPGALEELSPGDASEWPLPEARLTGAAPASLSESPSPNLDRFTENLTARALAGGMDPVVGRDQEVRHMIDILIRRRQNNPILTGDAGVGKTAVVEGLAQKVASGEVPEALIGAEIRALDLGLLQAGASMRGEFEKRLTGVIREIAMASAPIILFIDEAHTLIGAGASEGGNDASNLLKPALARGELRTIAATTWREYKKYVETDPALTRRFQVIHVKEPSPPDAVKMMRALARTLRDHHKVTILDDAIVAAVELSARYIPGRQLPDKAVSLLDTACARVSLSQSVAPGDVADQARLLRELADQAEWLEQENLCSGEHDMALADLKKRHEQARIAYHDLHARWQQESSLVTRLTTLRGELEHALTQATNPTEHTSDQRERFARTQEALQALQGEHPLVYPVVNRQAVASIVAQWTGIPLGQMFRDEIQGLLNLQQQLEHQVIGQPQAMAPVAARIQSARANLTEPDKPVGVFLMIGPSGTGKTETALTLARELFGGEGSLTLINMSEFKEPHKISMLLGSPPGYVGYGEGGVLTEAVRRKPYSVVLLDEMEKAHPGLQDIFYNIFDKGSVRDGEGRDIDFRNTVIIMTSNACEGIIREEVRQHPGIQSEALLTACQPELSAHFKAAFLGRTTVIPYYPLANDTLEAICRSRLARLAQRLLTRFGVHLSQADDLAAAIAERGKQHPSGARFIDNVITNEMLPALARECLSAQANQRPLTRIHVSWTEDGKVKVAVCTDPTA